MSSNDPTNAERCRRARLRKAGKLPPVDACSACGKRVLRPRTGGLCRDCWLKTPNGLADVAQRVRDHRDRKRQRDQSSN